MSEYFSKTVCKCGCENLLPQHLVDRGWEYLYNHKPKELRGHPSASKPVPATPAKVYSYADALKLAQAELPLLESQMAEFESQQRFLDAARARVALRFENLRALCKALADVDQKLVVN